MRILETKDINTIRPLYDAWASIAHGDDFGLDIDLEVADANMQKLLSLEGALLVAYGDDDKVEGFFALCPMPSFFGKQTIAMETMWFALPNAHRAGPALFKAARKWTKENGCSHLMVSGSKLASDLHDKVCLFCERAGANWFETVYLLEIT